MNYKWEKTLLKNALNSVLGQIFWTSQPRDKARQINELILPNFLGQE